MPPTKIQNLTSDKAMRERIIPTLGVVWTMLFAVFIIWLYANAPRSFNEAVTNAVQGVQVATNIYAVDENRFARGRELFLNEQYTAARDEWRQADSAERDARTQFYIAYSFYREGWGRFYSDDELFKQGLEKINQAIQLSPEGNAMRIDDNELRINTAAELKAEFEQGLEKSVSDFNPLRVTRERK